ncbi:hypothetical protein ACIA8K_25705 [Catenuloplanes sp. NPDC051500]|uniref:hypothetical protein n=1 Tax=Catenuloplanes sp. NPDC051500 TaxID=3363959 RepID=UPI0037A7D458
MLTRRPSRLVALLLAGAVVSLSACGSPSAGSGDGTTATPAGTGATGPGTLQVRSDLVGPQVVPWRSWRAVDDRTIEVTVTAGSPDCYGATADLTETPTAVQLRIHVGVLPDVAGQECPAIAEESVVLVPLSAPLGTRTVEPLP